MVIIKLFFENQGDLKESISQDDKQVELQLSDFTSADDFEKGLNTKTVVEFGVVSSMVRPSLEFVFQSFHHHKLLQQIPFDYSTSCI